MNNAGIYSNDDNFWKLIRLFSELIDVVCLGFYSLIKCTVLLLPLLLIAILINPCKVPAGALLITEE